MSVEDILACFDRITDQFLPREELAAKLHTGHPLRVKYGLDIKTPALHIGHAVNLWLLRALQDAGHAAVIVFSDFTNRNGDMDGRLETIWNVSAAEADKSIAELTRQLKMVLRFDDPALLEIRRSSEWYDRMGVQDMLDIFSLVTHARLISRDAFQARIAEGSEIHVNEMIYPVLRGYDSCMVRADIALLGSNRLFSESLGRLLQEKHKQKPQALLTTVITPGIDGRKKQSPRRHNDISLVHSPRDKFGRVMRIPDALIGDYFRVYTDVPPDAIAASLAKSPRDAKADLASAIVARYHGAGTARTERDWFDNTVSKGYIPDDLPALVLNTGDMEALDLVVLARPKKSRGDSRRLILQGGVSLNGRKITRPDQELFLKDNDTLQAGRLKWLSLRVKEPPAFHTERLTIRPVHVRDIQSLSGRIPLEDITKHIVRFSNRKKKTETDVRDAFKKIILQTEPKHESLWVITTKDAPDKPVGLAYLRSDRWDKPQNIWISPEIPNPEAFANEAMLELSTQALYRLDPQSEAFKKAFAIVTAPRDYEALHDVYLTLTPELLDRQIVPEGLPGFTYEGWEKLQQWRRITTPWLFKEDPRATFNKKMGLDKPHEPTPDGDV
ncbi:MAG: tyrosine--tRNA ligase [Alphaproteobacteria bacterium]|nr:tyrosine--tRNA ligase [Alphaproteobacteria bacterium]